MKRISYTDATEDAPRNIFQDPTLARAAEEDPLVKFFIRWWRHLLVAVVTLGAVAYARETFRESSRINQEKAAESYARVRASYVGLLEAENRLRTKRAEEAQKTPPPDFSQEEKAVEDARKILGQQLAILGDSRKPYTTISRIYTALGALRTHDLEAARNALSGLILREGEGSKEDKFFIELASLLLAKGLVDQDATYKEGMDLLRRLVREGEYANVMAAISFGQIARTNEEKSEAVTLLEGVKVKEPEQTDLIDPALKRLKGA